MNIIQFYDRHKNHSKPIKSIDGCWKGRLGQRNLQNTLIYIDWESKLFLNTNEGFTSRVAHNVGEAYQLIEAGFEYVTGDYSDGGKIFRKRS